MEMDFQPRSKSRLPGKIPGFKEKCIYFLADHVTTAFSPLTVYKIIQSFLFSVEILMRIFSSA